jgi:hypothetical protein
VGGNEQRIFVPLAFAVFKCYGGVTSGAIDANRLRKTRAFICLRSPTRSCHIWHRGAIYPIRGQEYISNRAALGGGLINRRPKTQTESGAFCFARKNGSTAVPRQLSRLLADAELCRMPSKYPIPENPYTNRATSGTEGPFTGFGVSITLAIEQHLGEG